MQLGTRAPIPSLSVPPARQRLLSFVGGGGMERVCFQLQVRPDRLEEYRERHRCVWPEMLEALTQTGWHNYSLFLRPDGLLIGYLETPDFGTALRNMEKL